MSAHFVRGVPAFSSEPFRNAVSIDVPVANRHCSACNSHVLGLAADSGQTYVAAMIAGIYLVRWLDAAGRLAIVWWNQFVKQFRDAIDEGHGPPESPA